MEIIMRKKIIRISGIILGGLFAIIIIGFAIYVYKFYPRKADSYEIKVPNPKEKILIATQSTAFKNLLVKDICDSLKSKSVYVKVIDVDELSEADSNDWDRVLIINSFIIRLNKKINNFLKKDSANKILLVVTAGGGDWLPKQEIKVDALTSASRIGYSESYSTLINDWLDHDLNKKWIPSDYLLNLKFNPRVDVREACAIIEQNQDYYKQLHPNLETLITQIAYHYLHLNESGLTTEILELNIRLFPESWKVYHRYGEIMEKTGKIDKAIMNYKKALMLNPDSKSTKEMLEKLQDI
jgi:tetratricopeptide (TPR) repeat protein